MMKRTIHFIFAGLPVALILLGLFPFAASAAPLSQGEDPKVKADALYDEGTFLYEQGDGPGAIDRFQSALTIYEEIGDQNGQSKALHGIGFVYHLLGEYELALVYEERALTIAQELHDQKGEELMLHTIGQVYTGLKQYPIALEHLQQALTISQTTGDRQEEGLQLFHIGQVYGKLEEYEQALDYYQQSLVIARELADRVGEGWILNEMGEAYQYGYEQYQQALDLFQEALVIAQELNDRLGELKALQNLGGLHVNLGKDTQALEYYQRSLAIAQEIGDREEEEINLNAIGAVYTNLRQYRQAFDSYQQSLVISRALGDREGEAYTLNNIAHLLSPEDALAYFQQVQTIAQELGDRTLEMTTLNGIGQVYENGGEYDRAREYYERALAISQELGLPFFEAVLLNNVGLTYKRQERNTQALDYFQRSLSIAQVLGDQTQAGTTLNNMARLYEQEGDNAQAINYYQRAIEITEGIGREIKVDEFRASYLAEDSARYEAIIRVLWTEGRFEDAFNYAERARARVFLDQIAGANIDFRAGVDANLLNREPALRSEITDLRSQLMTLRSHPQDEWDNDAIASAQAELTQREAEYAQLLTDIKLRSPEVAGLVSVDVASVAEIQSLLDSSTTLVEYFAMEDRTLAFIITKDTFESIAVDIPRDALSQVINDFRDFASLDDPQPDSLKQLYAWLIAPLRDKLTTSTIGIIPHGVLHYLPFAALTDGAHYLAEEYTVFTLPSASALRFIQQKRKPEANTILALGNPTINEPGLAPLNYAQKEVETIASMFGAQPLIGEAATESALRTQAGTAGIVHLAAHGQFNSLNPLFSVIYLAAGGGEDGRLEVNEIYGLDLTKATDLVVLSACETQVGEVSAGDEVVGMTRAFLYAGTPTVIASLWKVDDEATTLLMERFYQHLREGMGKAQALQQAQSEIRAQYPHPYYWAAFVLTGDPGVLSTAPLASSGSNNSSSLWAIRSIAALLVIVGGAFWWWRRKSIESQTNRKT